MPSGSRQPASRRYSLIELEQRRGYLSVFAPLPLGIRTALLFSTLFWHVNKPSKAAVQNMLQAPLMLVVRHGDTHRDAAGTLGSVAMYTYS